MNILMTAAEVAEQLGLTEDMVKRRTKAESWPSIKFSGKTIRYRAEHVEQIIAKYEVEAAVTTPTPTFTSQTARSRARTA